MMNWNKEDKQQLTCEKEWLHFVQCMLEVLGYVHVASTIVNRPIRLSQQMMQSWENIIGHRGENQVDAYMWHIPHLGDKIS